MSVELCHFGRLPSNRLDIFDRPKAYDVFVRHINGERIIQQVLVPLAFVFQMELSLIGHLVDLLNQFILILLQHCPLLFLLLRKRRLERGGRLGVESAHTAAVHAI